MQVITQITWLPWLHQDRWITGYLLSLACLVTHYVGVLINLLKVYDTIIWSACILTNFVKLYAELQKLDYLTCSILKI